MSNLKLYSQTTFLYFKNINKAKEFFENVLKLKIVDDQGSAIILWSC